MTILENRHYSLAELGALLAKNEPIALGPSATEAIASGRRFLDQYIAQSSAPVYGINTGFGSLCDVRIDQNDLNKLQENLVKSHACGMGEHLSSELVKTMMLLKILGLQKGNSGVELSTVQLLVQLYNHGIYPVVFELGSLGASGDLAPLAHLSLPLLGLGEVVKGGRRISAAEALNEHGLKPLTLQSKEGLALLNGTQFMSAHALHILNRLTTLTDLGLRCAALSLSAFGGRLQPFHDGVHALRPHHGQRSVAARMRELLTAHREQRDAVQDPYSFRCIPQVHGASHDTIAHAKQVVEIEVNAVTDNPTLLPDDNTIISAGNFHGQPLALVLDFLCIAMAELASISERRIYKLISGQRNLPPYLVANPGLNSGFMIAQYAAASIVSQNKQLCTPASVDTIDSSNGQEDHVSMGANAATKALKVMLNYERVLVIELITAAQAIDLAEAPLGEELLQLHKRTRQEVPFLENDAEMHLHLKKAEMLIKSGV